LFLGLLGALWVVASIFGERLGIVWPRWSLAFWAAAVWCVNLLLVWYGLGGSLFLSRIPLLAVVFGILMTSIGSGSYWATTVLFPRYRVDIEQAALFVAVCTTAMLAAFICVSRLLLRQLPSTRPGLEWDWERLRLATYCVFLLSLIG